jgi:general secretion pathway protein D
VPNLGVLARLLETEATANILSTPNILTLDNEEAKIVVGSNVPFITGQYAQTATGVSAPFQTYERRDVGLTLKIKPQITEGGIVRLNVFQEASSIQGTSLSNPAGPVTNKRSIESSIIVDDGGIIVIGGLIEDNYTVGEDKVPGLGDLPFFGGLFRYETRKRTKTNLMVFLRPQIIRDAKGYQGLTSDRYDYVIGEQQRTGINPRLMPGEPPVPALPAIGVSPRAPAIAPARR